MEATVEDDTLIWAFDRLLDCQALPAGVLVEHVLPCVASLPEELPDATRAKLCLRLVDAELAEGRVDENVLLYLQQLAACDVAPLGVSPALVRPSRDLLLQVKTELGIQAWRERSLPPREAEGLLNQLFAGQNSAEEYGRYEQLVAAVRNPVAAAALEAEFPFQRLLAALITFVARAQLALPSILKAIQDDVAAGRYEIGRGAAPKQRPPALASPMRGAAGGLRHGAAAVPQPRSPQDERGRAGRQGAVPSPPTAALPPGSEALPPVGGAEEQDDLVPSPPRQQQQQAATPGSAARGRHSVLRNLDAGLAELAHQGGRDPLPQMLQDAEGAAAAAAAPTGRVVRWPDDSPAVPHAAPQMRAARHERHGPLAQPSPGRQSGRRVAGDGSSDQQPGSPKKRRPRTRWQPEEEAELIRLVKQHGRGNWAAIVAQGQNVFVDRTPVDCKDKWRNLVKHDRITAVDLEETEAREASLRDETRLEKRLGRPPKFLSPKRQRVQSAQPEEEEEEEADRDDIDDADEEDDDNAEAEQEMEEDEEEEEAEQHEQRRARRSSLARAGRATHRAKAPKQPPRRSNRLH